LIVGNQTNLIIDMKMRLFDLIKSKHPILITFCVCLVVFLFDSTILSLSQEKRALDNPFIQTAADLSEEVADDDLFLILIIKILSYEKRGTTYSLKTIYDPQVDVIPANIRGRSPPLRV